MSKSWCHDMGHIFSGCSGSIHWQYMSTRTLRNGVLPGDLSTPGMCVGTLLTQCLCDFFAKSISDAWVLVSFSFPEGSETEEPQDVDEQATKEAKLRTMWTDRAVGNRLGGSSAEGSEIQALD